MSAAKPREEAKRLRDRAGLDRQERVDHVLNVADSPAGRGVELVVGVLILAVVAIYGIESELVGTPYADWIPYLEAAETGITALFLVEYAVRWWAKRFSLRYLITPMAIVDGVAVLPLFLSANLQFVRLLRIFRVLRLLRIFQNRQFFFGEVTEDHLMVLRILFTVFCLVFLTAGFVYEFEKGLNPAFSSLHDAVYFAVVTLTTVGFGDMTPVTAAGRGITATMILLGVMIIPWQLTNLARQLVLHSGKVQNTCEHCGLRYHDADASHCKACGNLIYQEYDGI